MTRKSHDIQPSGIPGAGFDTMPTEMIDPATGEIMQMAWVPKLKRNGFMNGRQYMAQQLAHKQLAYDDTLTPLDLRVYMALTAELGFENYLTVNVSQLAKELKRHRTHVSKSVSELCRRGIIHRGPKIGMSYSYALDPDYGYKGNAGNPSMARQRMKDQGFKVIEGGAGEPEEQTLPGL